MKSHTSVQIVEDWTVYYFAYSYFLKWAACSEVSYKDTHIFIFNTVQTYVCILII